MIRGGHVDRLVIYLAGKLGLGTGVPLFPGVFANIDDALDVAIESVIRVGSDLRIDAKVGN
jgi:riboflavin biosynthesis pyrimidine reductase